MLVYALFIYSLILSLFLNKYNTIITVLQNNIKKFCKDNIPKDLRKNKKIIWSVFDCSKDSIKKNCTYIDDKNYVPINTKATNEYKDANVLIYLVNRFINPHLYNFIKNYCPTGDNFSEDLYSLSELIQWIWRSAIRENKQICIYIASERMLNILLKWLNTSNNDTHITPTLNYGSSKNLSNIIKLLQILSLLLTQIIIRLQIYKLIQKALLIKLMKININSNVLIL